MKSNSFRQHIRVVCSNSTKEGFQRLITTIISTVNNLLMVHSASPEICHHLLSLTNKAVELVDNSQTMVLSVATAYQCLKYILIERSLGSSCDSLNQSDKELNVLLKNVLSRSSEICRNQPFTVNVIAVLISVHSVLFQRDLFILGVCFNEGNCSRDSNPVFTAQQIGNRKPRRNSETVCRRRCKRNETMRSGKKSRCLNQPYIYSILSSSQNTESQPNSIKDLPQVTEIVVAGIRGQNKIAQMVFGHILADLPNESVQLIFFLPIASNIISHLIFLDHAEFLRCFEIDPDSCQRSRKNINRDFDSICRQS